MLAALGVDNSWSLELVKAIQVLYIGVLCIKTHKRWICSLYSILNINRNSNDRCLHVLFKTIFGIFIMLTTFLSGVECLPRDSLVF